MLLNQKNSYSNITASLFGNSKAKKLMISE